MKQECKQAKWIGYNCNIKIDWLKVAVLEVDTRV